MPGSEIEGRQIGFGPRFEHVRSADPDPAPRGLVTCSAHDRKLGLAVTLLVLGADAGLVDRERFDVEAAALDALRDQPHVVTLLEHLSIPDGREVLILSDHVRPGWVPGEVAPRAGVALAIHLADALEAAHNAGWIHAAVQPSAIGRSATGQPVLAGFTVPKEGAETFVLHELTVHTAGELLLGEPPTAATDVYGLASALFELLSGRAAFRGYAEESDAALGLRILHEPRPALAVPGAPIELGDVLEWALAAEPQHRPPTAAWFAEELRRIEHAEGWSRTA